MNKALQISQAEHNLKQIEGNTTVASKKKRKVYSKTSGESSVTAADYTFPDTYSDFVDDLEACNKGDEDSKKLMERLVPEMAKLLKVSKQWDHPDTPFDTKPDIDFVVDMGDLLGSAPDTTVLDKIITEALEASSDLQGQEQTTVADNALDNQQAISNLLMDTCEESPAQLAGSASDTNSTKLKAGYIANSAGGIAKVTSVLSSLQPQREKPSKDRGRRFVVGALVFNKEAAIDDTSDSVSEFQFWTLKPNSAGLSAAKIFLLGQISLVMNGNTPIRSSENCPDMYVVATAFSYDKSSDRYYASGKTELSKSSSLLHLTVNKFVSQSSGRVKFNYREVPTLEEYTPFSENVGIEGRIRLFCDIQDINNYSIENESDQDEYVVERIITKKFNNCTNQYEFLVKWKDYSDKFNTWELSSNIPDDKIVEFEHSLLTIGQLRTQEARPGLRDRTTLKSTFHPDYISNA